MSSSKKRPTVVLASVCVAALLSACGGGGSETDITSTTEDLETSAEVEPERDSPLAAADMAGHDAEPVEDAPGTETDEAREEAQSLSIDSSDSGWAKPKVAALDYENNTTTSRRDYLAKFKFVILGARSGSSLDSFARSIKSRSSSTKIAAYTVFNEVKCSTTSSNYFYPMVSAANSADFWLRYASGSKAQWTSSYGACDLNLSRWARKDSSGRTWMQVRANFDYDRIFKYSPIEYVFSDNTMWRPRYDADWKRVRTNQSKDSSEIQSAMRAGMASYWSAIKSRRSSLKIIGNSDGDLSQYEYRDKLQGAFFEGAMGRSWSLETWSGFSAMRDRYRKLIANTTSPNDVFFQVYGSNTDYKLMRYGLAASMLENGWYVHLPSSGTLRSAWFDEYEAPIGKPIESPPSSPKSNGIWMRKYENGLVLVNPSKSNTATIDVGSGYKRLKGTQNSSVNNGQSQRYVTLSPRSGLLMIKQ